MKTLLLSLALFASSVNAQFAYNYEIPCDNSEKIIATLKDLKYSEKLTWTGNHLEDQSVYSLWTNSSTGTWTLLKMSKTNISCVLGVGKDSLVTLGDPT